MNDKKQLRIKMSQIIGVQSILVYPKFIDSLIRSIEFFPYQSKFWFYENSGIFFLLETDNSAKISSQALKALKALK